MSYTYNVRNLNVPADGVTDAQGPLETLLTSSAVPDNATLFFPAGVYLLSQPWVIDRPINLIGIDEETTGLILEFINAGTKVGTFSLPWMMEAEGYPETKPGTPIILTGNGSNQAGRLLLTKVTGLKSLFGKSKPGTRKG